MESSLGGIFHLSFGLIDYADMTASHFAVRYSSFETEGAGGAVKRNAIMMSR